MFAITAQYIKRKSDKGYLKNPMNKKISNSWWDNYRKTVKVTKRFRELVKLVGNREDIAQDLLDRIKQKYPGKEEIWYLNQLIAELKEENTMGLAY